MRLTSLRSRFSRRLSAVALAKADHAARCELRRPQARRGILRLHTSSAPSSRARLKKQRGSRRCARALPYNLWPLPLAPGARLGVYEVTAAIGEGGMGQVFRARDTKLNRDVALKILPDSFASDAERLQRFEREARTLAALNHPGIAQIYGTVETEGHEALVMELVPGRTLDEVIRDERRPDRRGPADTRRRQDCFADRRGARSRRTRPASCIAISSLPTSRSATTARSRCSISASRARAIPPRPTPW